MSSILVFRTECYKILHRRQSLILLLPALLAFLIVLGQAHVRTGARRYHTGSFNRPRSVWNNTP